MPPYSYAIPPLFKPPEAHLDPLETPVTPKPAPSSPEDPSTTVGLPDTFRHSGWKDNRRRVWDSMNRCRLPYSRLYAFSQCGNHTWILRHKDDLERFRAVLGCCHDRFCIPCAGSRQAIIRRNLDHYLADRPHRFLTLTIRNTSQDLAPLVTRLYKAFRQLRNRRFWKDRVRGGVAFLELTYNPEADTWNPHLHCMLDGKYLELQALSATWLAVTGDSKNVNIRLIRNRTHVTNYITKYATKPLPASVLTNPHALDEAILALRGRRTILTFGNWRHWRLCDDPTEKDWDLFDSLDAVTYRATLDDRLCVNILAMLATQDPNTGEFTVHVEPDPPYPEDT